MLQLRRSCGQCVSAVHGMNYLSFRMVKISNDWLRMLSVRFLNIGDEASEYHVVTNDDLLTFKRVTNDWNPIHERTKFSEAIVHGAFLNGLVSAILGTKLPGPGTIIVEQTLRFPNACFVGDGVTTTVRILSARKIIQCEYNCRVRDTVVLEGTAKLIVRNEGVPLKKS